MPELKILSSLLCHFLNPDSTQWKPGIGITKWQFKEFIYIKCQDGIPEITYRECRGVLPSKIYFRCTRESGFQFQFLRRLRALFLFLLKKQRSSILHCSNLSEQNNGIKRSPYRHFWHREFFFFSFFFFFFFVNAQSENQSKITNLKASDYDNL